MRRSVETYVEEQGDGPPIVLLHGFTGDTTTMHELSARLDGCGRRLLIDVIGHGKSDAPDWRTYAMEDAVGQIEDIAHTLDEPPVLIGYSMGARVAVAAAASGMPLRGLVTIGGRAGIADAEKRMLRQCTDNALADEILDRGIDWFVEYWERQPFYASQAALGDGHLEAARHQRLGNTPDALAASLRGMGVGVQEPLHHKLSSISCPTLVIHGELDVPFRVHANELADGIPGAELSIVPVAGHAAHVEAPAETARRIRAFLTAI